MVEHSISKSSQPRHLTTRVTLYIVIMLLKRCCYCGISDTMVCTGCCATLDHIVTYLFKQVTNKGNQSELCCDLRIVEFLDYLWNIDPISGFLHNVNTRFHFLFRQSSSRPGGARQRRAGAGDQAAARDPPAGNHIWQPCKHVVETWQPCFLRSQMLSTVLNIIMFEDCRNQWSMSRPLLGLILLNAEYFEQLRDQVCDDSY